jgi:hypothetical protein
MRLDLQKSFKIISILLSVALPVSNIPVYANWTTTQNPYTFGPQGRNIEDIQQYGKPKEMVSIVPKRPVAAKDKYGNRCYFTPSGKMTLKISKDGKMSFSLKTESKEMNKDGSLAKKTVSEKGSNRVTVKNEKGDVLGYQELGFGGKVVREYDYEGNLTKSYEYNDYGKSTEWILDELSLTKTVFNDKNEPEVDINFEGYEVAWYEHDKAGRLMQKEDIYGNVTHFDKSGSMLYTEDYMGNKTAVYNYETDIYGNTSVASVESPINGDVTYFENGKQTQTVNKYGAVTKEYVWDGSTLVYTFDTQREETTYYDIIGRQRYTMQDDIEVMRWMFHKGRLVGQWNQADNSVLVFKNQREDLRMAAWSKPPSGEEIQRMMEEGLIDDLRATTHYSSNKSLKLAKER